VRVVEAPKGQNLRITAASHAYISQKRFDLLDQLHLYHAVCYIVYNFKAYMLKTMFPVTVIVFCLIYKVRNEYLMLKIAVAISSHTVSKRRQCLVLLINIFMNTASTLQLLNSTKLNLSLVIRDSFIYC
jgi:hypothetical protein